MITRNNYEEFFMLYVDGELPPAERSAVENFVRENPDLREELHMLQQTVLPADEQIRYAHKEELLKEEFHTGSVHAGNYEEYFILYADNELDAAERKNVEEFIRMNPVYQQEFALFQQAHVSPDATIEFENKEILFKKEKERRVIYVTWSRVAVAAVLLLLIGYGVVSRFSATGTIVQPPAVAKANPNESGKKNSQPTAQTDTGIKTILSVTSPQPSSLDKQEAVQIASAKINRKKNTVEPKETEVKNNTANDVAVIQPEERKITPAEISVAEVPVKTSTDPVETYPVIAATQKPVVDEPAVIYTRLEEKSEPTKTQYISFAGNGDDEMNIGPASFKKNKLRGFLRKVSRVFDKTTSSESESKGVVAEK